MPDLDQPIDIIERELDLRSEMPFVQTDAQLHQLLAIARHADFRDGQHMFEQNTPISNLYLITQGDVELVADGQPSWKFYGSGAVGFLDFMMGRAHTRTGIARGHVRALEIDAADYREYMQDHSDIGQQIMGFIATTLVDAIVGSPVAGAVLHRDPDANLPDVTNPTLVDRLLLISRVPAFARATVQSLANLAANARTVRYREGDAIVLAGTHADNLSILVHGEVELSRPYTNFRTLRGPLDLVCHAAELSAEPRHLTARASRDSTVLQIDREELLDRLDEHYELSQSLFAYVASQREVLNNALAAAGADL